MYKKTILTMSAAALVSAVLMTVSFADSAPATKTCSDGTTSTATGKGACSKHGGVKKGDAAPAMTPPMTPAATPVKPAAAPAAATAAAAPAGATAKCKDGTYSKAKTHSGACSKHGGVDSFLDK